MTSTLIPLKSLPAGVNRFEFHLDGAFFAEVSECGIQEASLKADVAVDNRPEAYLINMRITGSVTVPCDRCLEPMDFPVDAEYAFTVKYGEAHDDDNPDGLMVLASNENDLDAGPAMRDTVVLALPLSRHHDNPSDCNPEMRERLEAHAPGGSAPEAIDPRWDALKGLKEQ